MAWEPQGILKCCAPTLKHYYTCVTIYCVASNWCYSSNNQFSILSSPLLREVVCSIPRVLLLLELLRPQTIAHRVPMGVEMVLSVHTVSDCGLKYSERVEAPEFPICRVQKPGSVVVPREMAGKSNFRYIEVRCSETHLYTDSITYLRGGRLN